MVWKTILGLVFVCSCQSLRKIEICRINTEDADCAINDKKFTLPFPEKMIGYVAMSEIAQESLASCLEQCNIDGNLAPDQCKIESFGVCTIEEDRCGQLSLPLIEGYFAFGPTSFEKIKSKLAFCHR
jgi:hypothetical protein